MYICYHETKNAYQNRPNLSHYLIFMKTGGSTAYVCFAVVDRIHSWCILKRDAFLFKECL